MLTYNTHLSPLVLPEYGRNIQRMVDHCLTIEDRDERTKCAYAIVAAMDGLHPELRNEEGYERKLWDHLAIMSGFALDIDWPVKVVEAAELQTSPERVPYGSHRTVRRHYGSIIHRMVIKASQMEPSEEREQLILLLANQMKKMMLAVNPDGVDDERIFNDLREISDGAIVLNTADYHLHEFQAAPQPASKKKKKRRRK